MARTKRSALLEFWSQRQKLELGRDHTETLASGRYLLYWRPLNGAAGSWRARFYDPATKKMQRHPLGLADDFLAADGVKILTYAQATSKAEKWFKEQERKAILAAGGEAPPEGPYTVADAMRDYLADLRRRGKRVDIVETTINAHILPPLGALDVSALTKRRLEGWHQGLAEAGRRRTGKIREIPDLLPAPVTPEELRQRKDTANRILTSLKAGLNLALKNGKAQGPAPWREVKPFQNVGNSRVRFLVDDEPRLLVSACVDPEFQALVIGGLATGARYGELGRCVVRDFSSTSKTLFIEFGKNGRSRHIHLDAEAVAWFAALVKGREASETLFRHTGVDRRTRAVSDDWMPYDQRDRMEKAYKAAGIPKVTFHELRHTYASHLILRGMPLLYVAAQLGHRDTRMVERHYGHLVQSAVAQAVKKHAPKMGIYGASAKKKAPVGA